MGWAARRITIALFALLIVFFVAPRESAGAAAYCIPGETPQFRFGFAHLKELLGETMGQPIECEHANPDNGDTLQQTSTGLSFYRKATNTPTFTNGWEHWAWTAEGLVYWTGSDIDPPGTATAAEPVEATPTTTNIESNAPVLSVAEVAAANRGAIIRVDVGGGCGSGFIVNSAGYIVTNEHVVTSSNDVSVRLDDGQMVAGTVIARDANHDIALLKIASGSYTTVKFGSSDDLGLAASLIVMGYPLCTTDVAVTTGILSTRIMDGGRDFIQTDATVNPGNSGGAAFDSRGAFIGIPTFKIVAEGVENTNFLIPINRVRSAFDSWISQHRAGALLPTLPTPTATATPAPTPTPRGPPTPIPGSSYAKEIIEKTGIAIGDQCARFDTTVEWADRMPGNPLPETFCHVMITRLWPANWNLQLRWQWPSGVVDWTSVWTPFDGKRYDDGNVYLWNWRTAAPGTTRSPGILWISIYINGDLVRNDSFTVY